ncbi:hypothetical protein PVK06_003340 [Gossypium arboreum]|uniref:Uncharacterized protein n=1 Tax=Gossypium arboreum TaxID=29729 RepID=A0ABR0R776_GOSAR|nr:hypothetical protein PVK06_003340 [Gossypium arboreum]
MGVQVDIKVVIWKYRSVKGIKSNNIYEKVDGAGEPWRTSRTLSSISKHRPYFDCDEEDGSRLLRYEWS